MGFSPTTLDVNGARSGKLELPATCVPKLELGNETPARLFSG
jgi:hypothetical protein